jgi:hypothetical protein
MKKFLFILGIVGLGSAVFAGGAYVGTKLNLFRSWCEISFLDARATDASITLGVVEMLDDNKIDEAKSSLNQTLDMHIMFIGPFLSDCQNQKSKLLAAGILARIARHREKYPASALDERVRSRIQDILSRAVLETEKLKDQNPPPPEKVKE